MSQPLTFDRDLKASDIQALSDADAIVGFFAQLGYDAGLRVAQTPVAMGITADSLVRKISRIERIAGAEGGALQVYLIELDSVTVAALDGFARALRNRAGEFLLVVTSDYEQLHFVLIEREESPTTPTRLSPPQVRVRPRSLALNRRDPGKVKLRVLRRFTYTEADPYAQFEKLTSAYTVAEWAEPLFNNRALVSDYFLTERLPDWPEWRDDPRPTYRRLSELYQRARERLGGQSDEVLQPGLTNPVLEQLGFSANEAHGADGPDVWLEAGNGTRVACLIYPWDRYLDGRDEKRDSRRSSDLPGARVVSVLQDAGVQWAILTNGKLWRLYSGAAHSTATNYYEIDLEETLASTDPNEAFRYFWLFFRAAAFARGPGMECFLDRLVGESEAFATSLGEELKRRIFEDVFPRLAQGFIAHKRTTSPNFEPDQDFLDQVFRATLTLLYRLLFVLFAEARDLLPVREVHGYAPRSLSRIKGQLASQAGPIADQREAQLLNAYGKDPVSTGLYEALLALFRAIDRGDPSVNLPLYDGGLFISDPDPTDDTAEAVAARFLNDHRVPDGELAIALDLLSRDVDPKRGDLVFVDFKSLGVRHLGSIYEGLLEFRLRVAGERMAIVRGKRTEEIMPYRETIDAQRVILREGRGKTAPERTLEAGAIYLENDKRERKATGSYYTPDHIVQYIVQEAVGPALDAHLEHLRARMREAQQAHQQAIRRAQAFQRQGMVGDDPEKVANDPRWIALADEVFEFRVLDPAMGSRHFLVEAVDFITDRLLVFLNGFPWNPVQAALQRTRETIQSELDRQGVSVDATKLNDLNLLKRQVLKRSVYGVDLNPMAVELAKVSLWLDCFTLGAPLSFLDHHLKSGNSIVGVTIGEVERALEVQHGQHYGTLFGGSEFTGIMSAVEMMKVIGGLPDVTPAQVAESRGQFRKASDELAPFKEMLDIYTSRWFGNRPTKTKGGIYDVTVEFLQTADSRVWLKHGTGIQRIGPLQRKAREVAQAAARAHRFFYWQLEFPEVFFGATPASQQVVQLRPDGGFDAVVGNPPWVRQETLASQKEALQELHGAVYDSVADTYVYFLGRALRLLAPGQRAGMIVPNKWLRADYGAALRGHLAGEHQPTSLIDFGHAPIFPDADTFPCILLVTARPTERGGPLRYTAVPRTKLGDLGLPGLVAKRGYEVPTVLLRGGGWTLEPPEVARLLGKLRDDNPTLAQVAPNSLYRGIIPGFTEAFFVDHATRDRLIDDDPSCAPLLRKVVRGRNIERWRPNWDGEWQILLKSSENHPWPWANAGHHAEDVFRRSYPSLYDRLKPMQPALEKRRDKGRYWWELRSCSYYDAFERPKIMYQDVSFHSWLCFDDQGLFCNNTCYFLPTENRWLLAVLNSSVVWWYLARLATHGKDEAFRLHTQFMDELPIAELAEPARWRLDDSARRLIDLAATQQEQLAEFSQSLKNDW